MEDGSNGVDGSHLLAFIERIETLETSKREIAEDITSVYNELKGVGFDAKIVRRIVAARKKSKDARAEENALLSLYAEALGQPDLFAGL